MARERQVRIVPGVLDDAALAKYASLRHPKCDTTAALASTADQLRGCEFFDVYFDHDLIGHYAIRITRWSHGTEAEIRGAVGHAPGVDLTMTLLPHIERLQLQGVDVVTVETRRPGLLGKLLHLGYSETSYRVKKRLKAGS